MQYANKPAKYAYAIQAQNNQINPRPAETNPLKYFSLHFL